MPEDKPKKFVIEEHLDRFRHTIETYVIGRTITGLQVHNTEIAIALSDGGWIKLTLDGEDIAITIPVAMGPDLETPQGGVM